MADSNPVINELCNFLEVAVHLTLYTRRVYPREVFERRRYADVTVYQSRHRELTSYVSSIVHGARQLMTRGELDALILSMRKGDHGEVLERFRFDLSLGSSATAIDLDQVRSHLRGILLRLHTCDTLLLPLPFAELHDLATGGVDGLTFSVELHTQATRASAGPLPASGLLDEWVECDLRNELGETAGEPRVVPLKSMTLEGLSLGLSVLSTCLPPAPPMPPLSRSEQRMESGRLGAREESPARPMAAGKRPIGSFP